MSFGRTVYYRRHNDQSFRRPGHKHWESDNPRTKNIGTQYYDDNEIAKCTCPRYNRLSYDRRRQFKRYSTNRNWDMGAGYAKRGAKRKVLVYLPETRETCVGSTDLSPYIQRKSNSFSGTSTVAGTKKMSSKFNGPKMVETNNERPAANLVDKKISALVVTVAKSTSPNNIHIEIKALKKRPDTTSKEHSSHIVDRPSILKKEIVIDDSKQISVENKCIKPIGTKVTARDTVNVVTNENNTRNHANHPHKVMEKCSSTSLFQRVYDLENPSRDNKPSLDILCGNRLESDYINIYSNPTSNATPIPELKSESVVKRRFEALRRMGRKGESKKCLRTSKEPSQATVSVHRNVSISSDPPSLEARSFTNAKAFSTFPSVVKQANADEHGEKETDYGVSPNVKGMFKLWGKKFNLDENSNETKLPKGSLETTEQLTPKESDNNNAHISKHKCTGFSFFKKSKDKTQPVKAKKGVTAGRCEIKDGLVVKSDNEKRSAGEMWSGRTSNLKTSTERHSNKSNIQIFRNPIPTTDKLDIKWNNRKYGTSSSTVFELMDKVYRHNGLVLKSRSELSSMTSLFRSDCKPTVNYFQEVQALMLPRIFHEKFISTTFRKKKRKDKVTVKSRRWIADKSKEFAQKTQMILQTYNVSNESRTNIDFITINIPEGFLSASVSEIRYLEHSSEQISKVTEYESLEGNEHLDKYIQYNCVNDVSQNDIRVTVSLQDIEKVKLKPAATSTEAPSFYGDTVADGKNVIEVGIITQSKMRGINEPATCLDDDLSDEESTNDEIVVNKFNLAESFMKEFCKNYMPLGLDLLSWCASDNQLRQSSEKNLRTSFENKFDGTNSCPNIYEDYQATLSSCADSYCSPCTDDEDTRSVHLMSEKFKIDTYKVKDIAKPDLQRIMPKDSIAVTKRRRMYDKHNVIDKWYDGMNQEPYRNDNGKHVTVPYGPPQGDASYIRTRDILSYSGSSHVFSKKGSKNTGSRASSKSCIKKKPSQPTPEPQYPSSQYTPPQYTLPLSQPPQYPPTIGASLKKALRDSAKSFKTNSTIRNSPEGSNLKLSSPDSFENNNEVTSKNGGGSASDGSGRQSNISSKSKTFSEVSKQDSSDISWPTDNVSDDNLYEDKAPRGTKSVAYNGDTEPESIVICEKFSCTVTARKINSIVLTSPRDSEAARSGLLFTITPKGRLKEESLSEQNKNNNEPHKIPHEPYKSSDEANKTLDEQHKTPDEPLKTPDEPHKTPDEPHKTPDEPHKTLDESNKAPDDAHKTNDELHKTLIEALKTLDKPNKTDDEAHKIPDEPHKTLDEAHKTPDEAHKTSDEAQKTLDEAPNTLDEAHKIPVEALKTFDNSNKTDDEAHKILDEPQKTLDKAQKTPNEPHNTPDEAQKTFDEAHRALDEAHKTPDEAKKFLNEAQKSLDDAHKKLDETHKAPDAAHKNLNEAHKTLDSAHKTLDKANKTPDEAHKSLDESHKKVDEVHNTLNEAHKTPDEAHKTLDETHKTLKEIHKTSKERHKIPDKAQKSLDEAHKDPDEVHKTLNKANKTSDEAHKSLNETHKTLDSAHKTLDEALKTPDEAHKTPKKPHKTPKERPKSSDKPHKSSDKPHKSRDKQHKSPDKPQKTLDEPHKTPDEPDKTSDEPLRTKEKMRFKGQDEDGKTLYERIDYSADHGGKRSNVLASSILDDVYKNSTVQIVSTPVKDSPVAANKDVKKDVNQTPSKSINNLLEISLKLRFMKDDKNAEVSVNKGSFADKGKKTNDIYIVRNGIDHNIEEDDKKDHINIKIIIKNLLKKESKQVEKNNMDEVYSDKICKKFQTVSTGYSNYMVDQTVTPSLTEYSVHRATIDLESPCAKPETLSDIDLSTKEAIEFDRELSSSSGNNKPVSDKYISDHLVTTDLEKPCAKPESLSDIDRSTKEVIKPDCDLSSNSVSDKPSGDKYNFDHSVTSQNSKVCNDEDYKEEIKHLYGEPSQTNVCQSDTEFTNELYNSNEEHECASKKSSSVSKKLSVDLNDSELFREKKEIMKDIFKKASVVSKTNRKDKVRKLKDMLKELLTSESDPDEVTTTCNEMKKNVYDCLTEKDIGSLNNCMSFRDTESTDFDAKQSLVCFPTKEANSDASDRSNWVRDVDYVGCMCSKMADRLCCGGGACLCKLKRQVSEATNCNLRMDVGVPNYRRFVSSADAETQQSTPVSGVSVRDSTFNKNKDIPVNLYLENCEPPKSFQILQKTVLINDADAESGDNSNIEKSDNHETNIDSNAGERSSVEPNKLIFETRFVSDKKYKVNRQKPKKVNACKAKSANILQSHEIKKAVLEIYAERIESKGKQRLVARLPKFVNDSEHGEKVRSRSPYTGNACG